MIVEVLGGLQKCELAEIETGLNKPVGGDLGIIADQILGSPKNALPFTNGLEREGDKRGEHALAKSVAE